MRSSIMAMGWADGPWKVSLNWQLICLPDDPIGENDFLRVIPTLTHYPHTTWKCVYIYNILFHYINSIFAYIYIYIYIYYDILSSIYSDILSFYLIFCLAFSTASWTRFGVPVQLWPWTRLELAEEMMVGKGGGGGGERVEKELHLC